jgi:hypothetical protein
VIADLLPLYSSAYVAVNATLKSSSGVEQRKVADFVPPDTDVAAREALVLKPPPRHRDPKREYQ